MIKISQSKRNTKIGKREDGRWLSQFDRLTRHRHTHTLSLPLLPHNVFFFLSRGKRVKKNMMMMGKVKGAEEMGME